jgi:galactarate dehydratase
MVVSLGCEKLQPERLLPPGSFAIRDERHSRARALDVVCLQDDAHVGFMSMVESILRQAPGAPERLNARRRETVPASELVVGVQCGGSDAFSGVTANPAVGFCTDLLVRAGASVMFSETTEVRDGVAQLTARAATPEVAQAIVREMAWYDAYLQRGSVDRSANTTPGNKAGGLSNIVEKAMGSIVKSAARRSAACWRRARSCAPAGLTYAATPASDFICGTLQLAAGMNLHVFTTGRGTPYGLAAVPVIKVATRSDLARRWHDLMDVNAGTIADGTATHRASGLGAVPPDAGRGQRPQEDLGRAVEAAQRAGAVQPGAGDLSGRENSHAPGIAGAGTASCAGPWPGAASGLTLPNRDRSGDPGNQGHWSRLRPRVFGTNGCGPTTRGNP